MLPAPRRAASQSAAPQMTWPDIEDDDGWQDMPVVRSDNNPLGLDDDDQKRYHYRPPVRLDSSEQDAGSSSNATGAHLVVEADTLVTDSWRQKNDLDESDYTRLRLDEDEESDAVHMRTKYLFNEDKAMTPLSQMQATKELLTEGQRIAYVGLCHLVAARMVRDSGRGWEGTKLKQKLLQVAKGKGKEKAELPVVESAGIWMIKIMARLYQHMELEQAEQKMIESLAEHGVDPSDLVPALMTTHTVKNPEFDPQAKKQAELGVLKEEDEEQLPAYRPRQASISSTSSGPADAALSPRPQSTISPPPLPPHSPSPITTLPLVDKPKSINPFGDGEEDDSDPFSFPSAAPTKASTSRPPQRPPPIRLSSFEDEDEEGDIGRSFSPAKPDTGSTSSSFRRSSGEVVTAVSEEVGSPGRDPDQTPRISGLGADGVFGESAEVPTPTQPHISTLSHSEVPIPTTESVDLEADNPDLPGKAEALPSLPGVSTTLSNLDEHVTLDIRWTVLCDLFLVLIADSVYDARSRAYLEHIATALGFEWLDVVRFENRVTDALEIQEAVERSDQGEVIEGRRKGGAKRRYAMMGAAAVGGGLVIGLSAGLLAPVIGAGLGAAFATIGITGTTGFLAGAGGAAVITTGGILTGANIAGTGMGRRMRDVRTFEFRPLHNNKRVCCYITMGGFLASKVDDSRLPFSVLDPIIGDVLSVSWEPEMLAETGSALKILTSEVLTQVGQQVLAATLMAALMSALQWPMILTKLGYLIDNPWSNALDRAKAAGLVLADVILQRNAGVRPVSLIGFSLGSRAIFYALAELARHKAYGLVQDVFLFGTTVTASRITWLEARSVVAGRFVNGFATNDWMLGYLFRATSGGINTVAGLRPVEAVPGLENVDVTEIISGHMTYRSMMPKLLEKVGLPVTADHFDEPDDPEVDMNVQERTIVNEAEEEAKKDRKKILGLFPRSAKSRSTSGSTTPLPSGPIQQGDITRPGPGARSTSYDDADADEDMPPREGAHTPGTPSQPAAAVSIESIATVEEDEAVRKIPKTAGFDFAAISKELGKEIDVDKIKVPSGREVESEGEEGKFRWDGERTGSAPPPVSVVVRPPPGEAEAEPKGMYQPTLLRSASYDFSSRSAEATNGEDDDEESVGDIAATAVRELNLRSPSDTAAWDRPSPLRSSSSSSFAISPSNTSPYTYPTSNDWSHPQSSSSPYGSSSIPRPAPPARPHPPEFMANPFAGGDESKKSGGGGTGGANGSGMWGWGKKQKSLEDEAIKNPW